MTGVIGPRSTVGILGAGQLGRMLALVARRMGYRVAVFGGDRTSPCGQVADLVWNGDYANSQELHDFAGACDVVTYEFENIPATAAANIAEQTHLRPGVELLSVAQNRFAEKTALSKLGLPTASFRMVRSAEELEAAHSDFGGDVILKANTDGYDGKGQWSLKEGTDAKTLWNDIELTEGLVEQRICFDFELSVIGGRSTAGECAFYSPMLNHHVNHILDVSISGCELVTPKIATEATEICRAVLEKFSVVGVLCIELFLTADGELIVNEIAPRPHNSGHLTIEAYNCSQFELQLRTICGLPLPKIKSHLPVAAMSNLLGQHLPDDWTAQTLTCLGEANLHLYGKHAAAINRKMGHITAIGTNATTTERLVCESRASMRTSCEIA